MNQIYTKCMYSLLIIIIIAQPLLSIKTLQSNETFNYQVMSGQIIFKTIDHYFDGIQSVSITNFTNQRNMNKNICSIVVVHQNLLETIAFKFYNVVDDYQRYTKVLYKFEDIQHLRVALDMILYKQIFIILFEHGQAQTYQLQPNGQLVQKAVLTLNTTKIDEGNFLIIKDQCLYISQSKVYRFSINGTIDQVKGFLPLTHTLQIAKAYSEDYIALVGSNVTFYKLDGNNLQFIYTHTFVTSSQINSQQIILNIIDIQFDPQTNQLYYLDQNEGLFTSYFSQMKQQKIFIKNIGIKEDSCQNLNYFNGSLYMTCPQLIQYQILSKTILYKASKVQFIPNQIIINQSMIFVFGDRSYSIYQTWDSIPINGYLQFNTKVIIYHDFFVVMNDYYIAVNQFNYQTVGLNCLAIDQMVGKNEGYLQIVGICSTYISIQTKDNQLCQLNIPMTIKIIQLQIKTQLLQVIGILIIIFLLISGIIWTCVTKIQIGRDYSILQQEVDSHINQDLTKIQKPIINNM